MKMILVSKEAETDNKTRVVSVRGKGHELNLSGLSHQLLSPLSWRLFVIVQYWKPTMHEEIRFKNVKFPD